MIPQNENDNHPQDGDPIAAFTAALETPPTEACSHWHYGFGVTSTSTAWIDLRDSTRLLCFACVTTMVDCSVCHRTSIGMHHVEFGREVANCRAVALLCDACSSWLDPSVTTHGVDADGVIHTYPGQAS